MAKHTWTDNELITKELLNSIEDRIESKSTIQKMESIENATEEIADLAGKFNTLIQSLKTKGYMK